MSKEVRAGSQETESKQTGGSAVLKFFEGRAARHVFGLTGSSSVPIFHEFQSSRLEFVPALQENVAVAMADGYARFAGSTGVLLYMFPGTATALSNLYNAWRDETPLLVVASQLSSAARRYQGSVGEAELAPIVAPFSRFAREISSQSQLPNVLEAAYRASLGPPGGPSFVIAPEDFLRGELDLTAFPSRTRERAVPAGIDVVADRLASSMRPLIIVGGQLRRCGGSADIEALADEFDIPVVYEPFWNDRLGISPGHRCALGQLTEGSSLCSAADFVLAIGCRLFNEVHPRHSPWFAQDAFVCHVNADPEKVEQSFGVDWSCACDPALFAGRLLEECRRRGVTQSIANARIGRLDEAAKRRSRPRPGPYSEVAEALSTRLEHGYLIDESVSGNFPIVSRLRGLCGERYVSTTGASLGWGIGAACGVALATGVPTTCVLGDGAFFFGVQGLSQALAMNLPITFVVLDNDGFGSTQWFEQRYAKTLPGQSRQTSFIGSDFRGIRSDIIQVARGFGVETLDAADAEQFARLLAEETGAPRLIRVKVGTLSDAAS